MGVHVAGDPQPQGGPGPSAPRWHLVLFGGWRLNGRGPPAALCRREERLLAYLALNGPAPRLVTAEALWPETTEPHALSNLRTTAHRVRNACAGLLAPTLDPLDLSETTLVDVRQFRTLACPSEPTDLPEAERDKILLGSGDLLPGWYDGWVLFEQERLTRQRLERLDQETFGALEADDPARALRLAHCATELDPLCESAQRALIQVHLRMGNRIRALRVYHQFRSRSHHEYGIEPSPLLEQLIEPLLGQADGFSRGGRAGRPAGRPRG